MRGAVRLPPPVLLAQAKPFAQVMGLMLGQFVDEYTVRVIDVFAMPQSGTGVSVEAVDPVFQTKMLDMLKQARLARCPRGHVLCPIRSATGRQGLRIVIIVRFP